MSLAWEVTEDDVFAVLERHGLARSYADPLMEQAYDAALDQADRIESAALHYTEMDAQTESALDEIENVLLEEGLLSGVKRFRAP